MLAGGKTCEVSAASSEAESGGKKAGKTAGLLGQRATEVVQHDVLYDLYAHPPGLSRATELLLAQQIPFSWQAQLNGREDSHTST